MSNIFENYCYDVCYSIFYFISKVYIFFILWRIDGLCLYIFLTNEMPCR